MPEAAGANAEWGIGELTEIPMTTAKRKRARLIRQVYEADPLGGLRCGGTMRIIPFIEQAEIIEMILTHLRL